MEAAEEALAYCHITSLLSLYYQALDTANWDTLEKQVMADDAVWEVIQHSPSGTVRDLAEGRDAMSQGTVRHFINTHVIKIEGHTARSTSHLQAVDSGTLNIVANGFVEAEHTKVPEGWRIKRYKIDEHITDADMNAFKATLGLEFE
jgi:hypothetical protein